MNNKVINKRKRFTKMTGTRNRQVRKEYLKIMQPESRPNSDIETQKELVCNIDDHLLVDPNEMQPKLISDGIIWILICYVTHKFIHFYCYS